MVIEHNAIMEKMDALTLNGEAVKRERQVMDAQIDKLLKESGLAEVAEFAEAVASISGNVLGSQSQVSPIKRLIAEMQKTEYEAFRARDLQAAASFVFETNLLRHASNTMVIARANQTKVYNAYRLQAGSFGALDAADLRSAHGLATAATNAFLGISNILTRVEELRPKRVERVRLLKVQDALPPAEEVLGKGYMQMVTETNEKNTAIVGKLRDANRAIASIPLFTLRQIAGLSESGKSAEPAKTSEAIRVAKSNIWTYQTDVDGKTNLRLPKKGVYHFVTIVKHRDEDLFLHKRVELMQGRDHKVALNQNDNVKLDYEAWDALGFKVRAPEVPPLKVSDSLKALRKKLLD